MSTDTTLQVLLLDDLTLRYGERQIGCESNRARKIWGLLAYLLCHRDRVISPEELIAEIWTDERANPTSALKTSMFRLRAMMDELQEGLGHTLILHKHGGYTINPDVPLYMDTEEFEKLTENAEADVANLHPQRLLEALDLYKKDFSVGQSTDNWVQTMAAVYHDLYIQTVIQAVTVLEQKKQFEKGGEVCRCAIAIDAFQEEFYKMYMRCLLAQGKRQEVITLYEEMSDRFLHDFGVVPDSDSRGLYRQALSAVKERTISPVNLKDLLEEKGPVTGSLLCDLDFFQNVYQANARLLDRKGSAIHIVLLSLAGKDGKKVGSRSMEIAMDNLEGHICSFLRRGDLVTRCSSSQFILMLHQTEYEYSVLVCERIIKGFNHAYPRTPVTITYYIQSMTPPT